MVKAVAVKQWVRSGIYAGITAGLLMQGTLATPASAEATNQALAGETSARQAAPTTTQLSTSTEAGDTRTSTRFTVHVMGSGGSATPQGSVTLKSGDQSLGSVFLDENGFATYDVDSIPQGGQQIVAVYDGSTNFASSNSAARPLDSTTSALPDYTIAANTTAVTIKAGQYATISFTLTPENGFNQLISYSCAGLPVSAVCTFTPQQVIADGRNTPIVTTLHINTVATSGGTAVATPPTTAGSRTILAFLFPGGFALLGIAAARRRLTGLRLLGLAALLVAGASGLSACSAQYSYYHHPPTGNPGTPAGESNVTVYASSSSGNVATVHTTLIALTVTK